MTPVRYANLQANYSLKINSMKNSALATFPMVSIIIPCFNSETGLRMTLNSITAQDYPRQRWEVIVVDNNSTDNSYQTALDFASLLPSLKVEKEAVQSSYAARNRGIRAAAGEILAFIDADMTVRPDWMRKGVHDLTRTHADYLGCHVEIYSEKRKPNLWELYDMTVGFPIKHYIEDLGFAGAGCLFVKKPVFDKIGNFDSRFLSSGDLEFGTRVNNYGFKQYFSEHNIMRHPARSTVKSFVSRTARVARGGVDLKLYYPERFGELRLLSILSSCFKPVRLHKGFKSLEAGQKALMVLMSYYLHAVQIASQIIRYVQLRFIGK